MTGFGQFCPVALGAEIFAERWTPLILRELLSGVHRFGAIHHGMPRMSRNLLAQRLVSLEHCGVIQRRPLDDTRGFEYHLTDAGRELADVVEALGVWGYRWASKDLTQEHLDPDFLLWAIRRNIRVNVLPERRVVVHVSFRDDPVHHYWLLLQRPEADLCVRDPGHEVDLEMLAEAEALARVYLGQLTLPQAVRDGRIELRGAPRFRRELAAWIGVTHFAAAAGR